MRIGKVKPWTIKPPVSTRINWGHPLAKGLVYSFSMREGGGKTLFNGATFPLNATTIANPSWTTSFSRLSGKCLSFNGSNQYVSAPSGATFGSTFTLSAWVFLKVAGNFPMIISNGILSGGTVELRFSSSTVKPDMIVNGGNAGSADVTSPTAVSLNTWHLITGTADGSKVRLYVDGKLVAGPTSSTFTNWSNFYIGSRNGTFFLNGNIDDVRAYNRALSASEVMSLYANPFSLYVPQMSNTFWVSPSTVTPPASNPGNSKQLFQLLGVGT